MGHSTRNTLTINLLDVNDSPPEWLNTTHTDYAEVHIVENSLPTKAIFQLAVVDRDQAKDPSLLRFYAVDGDDDEDSVGSQHFFAVSSSGSVFLRRTLDAEKSEGYMLRFMATDGLLSTQSPFILKVIVDDVDDNSPVCQMVCSRELVVYCTLSENVYCNVLLIC